MLRSFTLLVTKATIIEKITVLLVEDEQTLAMIIKDTLEGQNFIIHTAADGEEGLRKFFDLHPDVLVADVMMPRMDGFEMVRRIRQTDKQTPVLFLTARSAINDVVEGFELGANDYLKKPFGMQELIIRIKALVGKAFSFTEEKPKETTVFEIGDYRFNSVTQRLAFAGSTPTSPNADTEVELSHRESEILKRLCENRNQVVNTQNVLLDLWGDDSFFNSRSLHVFITKLRHKLAGDERIREKMDLDVDVARLRLMKANHQSQQYRLEDNILRHFPAQIEENKGFLSGFEADMKTLEAHPHPKDGFAGMEVKGDFLTDKDNAGAAILEAFKDAKGLEPVPIGSYRGFSMSLTVENFGKDFILTLKGRMSHRVELGKDARGNLVRIDNALAQMPERYKTVQGRLENVQAQLATAKAFPQETELKEKSARLAELNAELNIDDRTPMEQAAENVVAKRPSVLGKLKAPCVHGAGDRKKSHEQEAR